MNNTKQRKTQNQKNEAKLTALYLSTMNDKRSTNDQKSEANKTAFLYNCGRLSYEEALVRLFLVNCNNISAIYTEQALETFSELENITQNNK